MSVVIVAYNSSPLLIECVQSALASSLAVQVIVSDNGSTDLCVDALEEMAVLDGRLQILRNDANLGFAKGNNVALPLATGDYILFLNPDCLVQVDTISRVLAVLSATPDAGMAGCLIRNLDGSEETSGRRLIPTPRQLLKSWLCLGPQAATGANAPSADKPYAVEAISGAFMLVRKTALDQLGSFDESYFMHWEDLDLCLRFTQAGRQIIFVPDVEVVHAKGRSSRATPLRVEWHKHVGMVRYFRKFFFQRWPSFLFAVMMLPVWCRFMVRVVLRPRLHEDDMEEAPTETTDNRPEVWVFGASSMIGDCLLPGLIGAGYRVRAFCRHPSVRIVSPHLTWHELDLNGAERLPVGARPELLIHLAPLPLLSPWIELLAQQGVRRVIAFGSVSRFTKQDSGDPGERALAASLAQAEAAVTDSCERHAVQWVIFRSTMIYGFGRDRNIASLARFIRRFHFFPLFGAGSGLRQPVHAQDLAKACLAIAATKEGWNRSYNVSGGQVLSYRQLIEAIFSELGQTPRIISPPLWCWQLALSAARMLPAYRSINLEIAKRMNADLCFDHDDATRNFGFSPRPFQLDK